MQSRLILFDIDGTLVDLRGVGLRALQRAATDLHGEGCPELDLRGATDSGLAHDILRSFGVGVNEESVGRFFRTYLAHLEEGLGEADFDGVVLPGVPELLERLRQEGAALGLLTGNIAAGAQAKIQRFGLADYFSFGAFGDDHHDRNKLGPIALDRAAEVHGRRFAREETIVVGDTPKDTACGKALGAITVCVATGQFGVAELRRSGADLVMESFGNVLEALDAIQTTAYNRD